ncbi:MULTISPECIES: PAAR domain-containing protein, partial [Enterobacterales]
KIASGSATVFIEGLPAARAGDAVDCGGNIVSVGTVIIG